MLKVGDTVKFKESVIQNWPKGNKDYLLNRTGTVTMDEKRGWVRVRWDKPRWDDPNRFEDIEIAECLEVQ